MESNKGFFRGSSENKDTVRLYLEVHGIHNWMPSACRLKSY